MSTRERRTLFPVPVRIIGTPLGPSLQDPLPAVPACLARPPEYTRPRRPDRAPLTASLVETPLPYRRPRRSLRGRGEAGPRRRFDTTSGYAFCAHTMASPMPVLPLVASTAETICHSSSVKWKHPGDIVPQRPNVRLTTGCRREPRAGLPRPTRGRRPRSGPTALPALGPAASAPRRRAAPSRGAVGAEAPNTADRMPLARRPTPARS
jgi:hypothetical protein